MLTNLGHLRKLSINNGTETFILRAMESKDFVSACHFTTNLEKEVSNEALHTQSKLFLRRAHPIIVSPHSLDDMGYPKNVQF